MRAPAPFAPIPPSRAVSVGEADDDFGNATGGSAALAWPIPSGRLLPKSAVVANAVVADRNAELFRTGEPPATP